MKLTEGEIADRGRQLADPLKQISDAEEAKSKASKAASEAIGFLRTAAAELADEIRTGQNHEVQVELPLGNRGAEEATL